MNTPPVDPAAVVDLQLAAYNTHDLAAFLATHAENVEVEGRDGATSVGRGALADRYGELFARGRYRAEVAARLRNGPWVVDHETAYGMAAEPISVLVAYQVRDGLIDRVRFMA